MKSQAQSPSHSLVGGRKRPKGYGAQRSKKRRERKKVHEEYSSSSCREIPRRVKQNDPYENSYVNHSGGSSVRYEFTNHDREQQYDQFGRSTINHGGGSRARHDNLNMTAEAERVMHRFE